MNEPSRDTGRWDYARLDADECSEIADLLRSLYPHEWEAPSLCDRWRVRDVVGHLITIGEVNPVTIPFSLLRHGLSFDRWLGTSAVRRASGCDRGGLIFFWDLQLPHTGLARFRSDGAMLYEHFVHHQDMRRPLGRQRQVRPEMLQALLDLAPALDGAIRSKQRAAGLRLEATDVEWVHGEGPVVRGSGEALLLALAGRPSSLDELAGDGLPLLAGCDRRVGRG